MSGEAKRWLHSFKGNSLKTWDEVVEKFLKKYFPKSKTAEGKAVISSWWTVKTDFKRSYQKIGDFWLPESNESETKVRVFGTAVLTIEYREYAIRPAGVTVAFPQEVAPNGQ